MRAAGAVLWRADGTRPQVAFDGDPEGSPPGQRRGRQIAVIHRPRYDDWTLPKGKLDPGEDDASAAMREIEEETGQRAEILRDLGEVSYRVTKRGVTFDKVVRYFEMRVTDPGEFVPDDEVDEVRWLPASEVIPLLTYDRDADIVRRYDPSL